MLREFIPSINEDIKRTRRAIVALGCSFVQGVGALNQTIYDEFPWEGIKDGHPCIKWHLSDSDELRLVKQFPDIEINLDRCINFVTHEVNNSFVNVLAKKYFDGQYAAINLGRSGNGNRAAIKELYFYPGINWKDLDEIIVIYCPSGPERFDFISDKYHTLNEHGRWISMWPNTLDETGPKKNLWEAYKEAVYSSKFEILEQLAHVQELKLWCNYMKAKLIIVPGFMNSYTKENFIGSLQQSIKRDNQNKVINIDKTVLYNDTTVTDMVEMWPWENMFAPAGALTFVDLVMQQEFPGQEMYTHFYEYVGKGSPNNWITPCAHPSAKGHDLFAQHLYKHITETL